MRHYSVTQAGRVSKSAVGAWEKKQGGYRYDEGGGGSARSRLGPGLLSSGGGKYI